MTDNVSSTVKPKKTRVRISDEMRRCVEIMANTGIGAREAAVKAGINPDTAVRNLRKSHVLKLFNELVHDIRINAAQAAYLRINDQSLNSNNERVKFEASKWIAGVDGLSPVQRVESRHSHRVTFGGFSYPDLEDDNRETL
jgi:hypothetical protein